MPKQNFDHERLSEDDQMQIALKSFYMQAKDIAEELNVTPGAVGYWLKQPYVKELRAKIRKAKEEAIIAKALQLDKESPQTDMFQ